MADAFAKLSDADKAKLEILKREWERDGEAAFRRFAKRDPDAYLRLVEVLEPSAVRDASEDGPPEQGLTDVDFSRMADAVKKES